MLFDQALGVPWGVAGLSFAFGGRDMLGGRVTSRRWQMQLRVRVCKRVGAHACVGVYGKARPGPLVYVYHIKQRKKKRKQPAVYRKLRRTSPCR